MPRTLLNEEQIHSNLQGADFKKRRAVLKDTVEKLDSDAKRQNYFQKAQANHQRWKSNASASTTNRVRVIQGDWGEVTQELSKEEGKIYAVLNMANAFSPGGGYLEGMVAQEENMYRRTDCHFHVTDDEMNPEKNRYTQEMTDFINGKNDRVYLDTDKPRVCIKGQETKDESSYRDLDDNDYFLFYELKSAADDLRGGHPFNESSMRKKIAAQLETLHEKGIRDVVLSAFGCGAFKNPPQNVARLFREELEKRPDYFDNVVFAIFSAGYGNDNYTPFAKELHDLPLTKVGQGKNLELLSDLLENLSTNITAESWDKKGYCLPFFDFRKTPKGIEDMRVVFNEKLDPVSTLNKLKSIADYRLAHPPLFTKRDEEVRNLYTRILSIDINTLDDLVVDSFKLATTQTGLVNA
ncbi:poly(ADP-ribose) glycohydrolase domain-containing protein [Legionella cardiaca]|uniref:DUF2263 domain-containing protein n=1 Tax=Legionella cardiaca TaxID=1071983 RepID=A0ABY8AS60_9GAMM|nr:poly(ADP-ribose) glycohydrolase domain-containing protein [Legionella cardiaca]WED42027.1 DUF2263 domain-containing protein [Legionella cardiaca]